MVNATALTRKTAADASAFTATQIGFIPEDWTLQYIEEFCNISTGGRNTQDRVKDGEFPFFVRSQTIENIDRFSYDEEAILTAGDGVGTGKVFHYVNGKYDAHQRVYRMFNFSKNVSGKYFFRYFSEYFYARIMQMTAKSSVDSVRREMISRMPVALPSTRKEQEAIAEALSDADDLIESIEQLIVKKRQIKQGAMQELLVGERRLGGFTKKWKFKPLMDLCSLIVDGTHFTPKYVTDGIPFYSVENVTADNFHDTKFITEREHDVLTRRCRPQINDILMTRIGSIGDTKLIDWEVNASIYVSLALLRPNSEVLPQFLYVYSKSRRFVERLEEHALMNAIPRKINMGEIGKITIPVPDFEEQQAISSIFSDMDFELQQLQTKLQKARYFKQGMAQELLTGGIRLI